MPVMPPRGAELPTAVVDHGRIRPSSGARPWNAGAAHRVAALRYKLGMIPARKQKGG